MNKCVHGVRFFRSALQAFVLLAIAVALPSSAQTFLQPSGASAGSIKHPLQRDFAIEHHFQSLQPNPLAQFDGAVPGSTLLLEHRLAGARVQARQRAIQLQTSQTSSTASSQPGLELRPFLQAGLLPTSVTTGDFNGDGHMDFVVANGRKRTACPS